jgi:cytochrome c-type biogenesis protein CcmF
VIVELGHFALILGFCFALVLAVLPLWGVQRGDQLAMASARYLSFAQFVFTTIAMVCLVYAFMTDDFSVDIVAAQSNSLLPAAYKFSALWGGHQPSGAGIFGFTMDHAV